MKKYIMAKTSIAVSGGDGFLESAAKGYEADFEKPDLQINYTRRPEIPAPAGKPIGKSVCGPAQLEWYDEDGVVMYSFNEPTGEYVLRTRFSADWRRADAEVLAAMTGEFVMKNITDIILRIAMIPRGCITIHSSSLAYNGRGLMFSAPSGTGKSTHTGLWQKYRPGTVIVNDDMPMINTNGEITLCGTPFAGTTGINTNINVPLAAVVFLRRAAENSITPLSAAQALAYLSGEISKFPVKEIAEMQFDLINKIISHIPVYLLQCDISENAVDVSSEILKES